MTDFQKKPLGILDRIYGLIGGLRGVSQLELKLPIQLVHDVSEQAERASGRYWLALTQQTHVGAGTITDLVAPYLQNNPLARNGFNVNLTNECVWFIDAWQEMVAGVGANFGGGGVYLAYNRTDLTGIRDAALISDKGPNRWLIYWKPGYVYGQKTDDWLFAPKPPIRMYDGDTLHVQSTETGGVGITVNQSVLFWVGPIDAVPPRTQ